MSAAPSLQIRDSNNSTPTPQEFVDARNVLVMSTNDTLAACMLHSNANMGFGEKSKIMAESFSSSLRHRHLTMGSGYQNDTMGKIQALTNETNITAHLERHALSSEMGADVSLEEKMRVDLIQASLSSMSKELIEDIASKASTYTAEQREKFVTVFKNTYQLQMVNDKRIKLPTSEIERLAKETLDAMRDLAHDMVLPNTLKATSLDTIKTTAIKFPKLGLDADIAKFEADTTPASILENSVDALKETLMAMLEQEDLEEKLREEIESILEKLNDLEDGEPLPRDVLKALSELSETLSAGEHGARLTALSEQLSQNIEVAREANIHLKAEKSDMTVDQVRAIEATMDRLEAMGEDLPQDEVTLKDMIAEAITALDTNPASVRATAALDAVQNNTKFEGHTDLKTSLPFVQTMITNTVSRVHGIPVADVKTFSNAYAALKQSVGETAKEAMHALAKNPISIAAAGLIETVANGSNTIGGHASKILEAVKEKQISLLEKFHDAPPKLIETAVTLYSSLKSVANDIIPTGKDIQSNPIVQKLQDAMDALNKSPLTVTALVKGAEALFDKGLDRITATNQTVKEKIEAAREKFEGYKDRVVVALANKSSQSKDFIRENIGNAIKQAKQGAQEQTQKAFSLTKAFAKAARTNAIDLARYGMSFAKKIAENVTICGVTCRGAKGCCPGFNSVAENLKKIRTRLTPKKEEDKADLQVKTKSKNERKKKKLNL